MLREVVCLLDACRDAGLSFSIMLLCKYASLVIDLGDHSVAFGFELFVAVLRLLVPRWN